MQETATLPAPPPAEKQEPKEESRQRPVKHLPVPGRHGLAMRTLEDMWRFAQYMATSPFAPKGMTDARSIVVAIQMGAEIGLAPTVAVRSIAVINGRPSLWGDALLGLCQAHESWDIAAFEETIAETPQGLTARCTVKRNGGKPVTREFTMTDAKRAGLASKQGPWTQYPKRMLQMRARSWALRDTFSDVLQGIASREEAVDFIDVEPTPSTELQREPGESKTQALTKQLASTAVSETAGSALAELRPDDANTGGNTGEQLPLEAPRQPKRPPAPKDDAVANQGRVPGLRKKVLGLCNAIGPSSLDILGAVGIEGRVEVNELSDEVLLKQAVDALTARAEQLAQA